MNIARSWYGCGMVVVTDLSAADPGTSSVRSPLVLAFPTRAQDFACLQLGCVLNLAAAAAVGFGRRRAGRTCDRTGHGAARVGGVVCAVVVPVLVQGVVSWPSAERLRSPCLGVVLLTVPLPLSPSFLCPSMSDVDRVRSASQMAPSSSCVLSRGSAIVDAWTARVCACRREGRPLCHRECLLFFNDPGR